MRAAVCRTYGPPEVVVVEEIDASRRPGPGEVLVETRAAAVNFPDVLIVADKYQISVPVPFTPGSEIAGIVRAVGAGVDALAPGDAVFGAVMIGAFAEQVVVSAAALTRIPDGFDFGPAAAFGVAHTTVVSRAAFHRGGAGRESGSWSRARRAVSVWPQSRSRRSSVGE